MPPESPSDPSSEHKPTSMNNGSLDEFDFEALAPEVNSDEPAEDVGVRWATADSTVAAAKSEDSDAPSREKSSTEDSADDDEPSSASTSDERASGDTDAEAEGTESSEKADSSTTRKDKGRPAAAAKDADPFDFESLPPSPPAKRSPKSEEPERKATAEKSGSDKPSGATGIRARGLDSAPTQDEDDPFDFESSAPRPTRSSPALSSPSRSGSARSESVRSAGASDAATAPSSSDDDSDRKTEKRAGSDSKDATSRIAKSSESASGPSPIDPEPKPTAKTTEKPRSKPAIGSGPVPEVKESVKFRDLGLEPSVLESLDSAGFVHPTPIQEQAIPVINEGGDLIGKAETGTGKTLAFLSPILGKIEIDRVATQALVMCPTRELAQQVEAVAAHIGEPMGLRTALVVGGVHASGQIIKLREGAHLVVGTPGRLLDMINGGYAQLGWVHHLVLDEADRMLDMGFIDEVSAILERVPQERQTLLFSATVPSDLKRLCMRFMNAPRTISTVKGTATVPQISQFFLEIHPADKEQFIVDLIADHPDDTCIVFCNTRRGARELDRTLWGAGFPAAALHGDQDQDERFRVLEAFKTRNTRTLVATDVAARGLDVESVGRVVNYDIPDEVETYIHRIGRTGRAGGVGESISLVTRKDDRSWAAIRSKRELDIKPLHWERLEGRRRFEDYEPARDDRRGRGGRGGGFGGGGGRRRR